MYHPRPTLAALALGLTTLACGHAPPADLHSTFARIQEEEARIEHAAAARAASDDPDERSAACDELCDASASLCMLARESEDRDALLRCERAEPGCAACRDGSEHGNGEREGEVGSAGDEGGAS